MPISKINPDGTVKIYNSKTKEIRDVSPTELGNYNPALIAEYDKLNAAQQASTAQQELAQSGNLDINELAKTDPVAAQKALAQGAKPALSAEQEKRKISLGTAERVIGQLEDLYLNPDGTSKLAGGRLGGTVATGQAMAGANQPLNTYLAARESSRPTLARAFGDVGNLSQPEQEAAVGLLPTGLSTPEEAQAGFAEIRKKLGLPERTFKNTQSQGLEPGVATQTDQKQSQPSGSTGMILSALKGLSDFFIPNIKAFPSEVKKSLERQAARPNTKGDLGGSIQQAGADTLDMLKTVAPAGIEGGAIPGELALAKGILSKIIGGSKTITVGGAAAARKALAEATTTEFSGNDLIKAAEKYVTNDPLAQRSLENLRPSLENQMFKAPQLLEKISIWNDAYNAAGQVGKSSKAGLYNVLSKAARSQLGEKAPEVLKAQQALKAAIGKKEFFRKVLSPTAIGATAVGTGIGVGVSNLLRGQ